MEWAIPVRPDELGAHLEAYERSLPTLYTLRLCRRYGQGPASHITKIPLELLWKVEDFVIAADRKPGWNEWKDALYHYESRCHPKDHFDEPYRLFPKWMFDEASHITICADCARRDLRDPFKQCDKQRDVHIITSSQLSLRQRRVILDEIKADRGQRLGDGAESDSDAFRSFAVLSTIAWRFRRAISTLGLTPLAPSSKWAYKVGGDHGHSKS